MTRTFTLLALAVACAGSTPAFAQDDMAEQVSRIVRYDDLNLTSAKDRQRLETRLRSAVNSVCGVRVARTLSEREAAYKCREVATNKTRERLAEAVRKASRMAARDMP